MNRLFLTKMAPAAIMLIGLFTSAQAAEMLTGHSQMVPIAVPPAGSLVASGIVITSVTIGYASGEIPCYNFFCGGQPNAISIPLPVYEINPGASYTITIQVHDFGYTGTSIVSANVFQGGKIIAYGAELLPALTPGYVTYQTFNGTVPSTTGPASILVELSDSTTGMSLAKNSTSFDIP